MRFVFLQPELRSKTNSHFYHYIEAIKEALTNRGHSSITIANEVFEEIKGTPEKLTFKNHISRYSNPLAVLWRIISLNIKGYFEFKKIIGQLASQDPQTVFFVDTILNDRVIALAMAFKKQARKYPFVKLGVVFRFTYRSNSGVLTFLQKILHKNFCLIQHKLMTQKRSIMFTDSILLKEMYTQNISEPVQVIPIPLRSELYEKMQINKEPKNIITKIGFIGGKVGYKGLDKFLHIIVSMMQDDLQFLVHGVKDKEDLFVFAKAILTEEEILLLRQNDHKILTFFHLDEKEYLDLFDKMDLILIPYTSRQFAEGTSNIFAESVSAGVIPMVPSNTWMGEELKKNDLQELVVDFNNLSCTKTVLKNILKKSDSIKQKMNHFSNTWRSYHSSQVFADQLISSLKD